MAQGTVLQTGSQNRHGTACKDLKTLRIDEAFTNIQLHWIDCFFFFIFISWRLITLQYCSGFCHTLIWISHGFACVPHPIPLSLPSAPALSTCLMHPTWAGDQTTAFAKIHRWHSLSKVSFLLFPNKSFNDLQVPEYYCCHAVSQNSETLSVQYLRYWIWKG